MAANKGMTQERVAEAFKATGGNVSATAQTLGITRQVVRHHLQKTGLNKKPLIGGHMKPERKELANPPAGRVRRYLLTAAQNNTPLNEKMWQNLQALAEHYDAAIMVGTFTYNSNAYGELSVKRGTKKERIKELWYDPRLIEHIVDEEVELGNGLVWCGRMNILPTAVDPLSGLDTYSHRKSSIFPHAKLAMRSVAVMQGEWAKQMFTTGCVTQLNYIQKKEGIKAEHHHSYSALMVEVNDKGNWFVRQVHAASKDGSMQDLDVVAKDGKVTTGNRVEAVNWGDLHATMVDPKVLEASLGMLKALRPKYQFLHDVMEGASTNPHESLSPHRRFHTWLRGLHRVDQEVQATIRVMSSFYTEDSQLVVADSNHDGAWLYRWLKEFDYRKDPANAELFLRMQTFAYQAIRQGSMVRDLNLLEFVMLDQGLVFPVKFLLSDQSFLVCGGKIECGMHGHLGPNGARGTPQSLNKVGRRANIGHTHCPGIYNGLYVAGTSTKLRWDYNRGPSGWNHAHILTYPNGARSIVTLYDGLWRA